MQPFETVRLVAGIFALGFLTESMVEYLFGQAIDHFKKLEPLRWALMYVAAAVGVGLSFYYGLDLVSLIFEGAPSPVGIALTGLAIGRGANYLHQFVSTYLNNSMLSDLRNKGRG